MMLWSPELAVVPVTIHLPLREIFAASVDRARGRDRAHRSARSGRPVPHRAAAARRRRAQSARRRRRHARRRGPRDRRARRRAARRRRHRRARSAARRLDVPRTRRARATTRRLCMYHDQALIPIKTLAFDHAVNVTLGLPFVRTSPDHGTAFDIAGTGTRRSDEPCRGAAAGGAARHGGQPGAARRVVTAAPDGLPPLREVIRRHGLAAKKSLGQNFLLDLNLAARIARAAGPLDGVTVFEVGPGPGGLTRALLALGAAPRHRGRARRARDRRARSEIAERYPGRLDIVAADALTFDPQQRVSIAVPARIVANLPYNIATALLVSWLTRRAVAALVRRGRPDVPARSRRAHRRGARLENLRPAVGAGAAGAARRASCSTSTPRPSCRRRRSPRRWCGSCRGRRRCPAIARALETRHRRPPSASAARCCARACARSASMRRHCSRRPASTRRRAPRTFRSRVSSRSRGRSRRGAGSRPAPAHDAGRSGPP